MSREQRRSERKQTGRTNPARSAPARPLDRRTPVPAPGGGGLPTTTLAILGGVILLVALIGYLIYQSSQGEDGLTDSEKAEQDADPNLPGDYYPPQGRGHANYTFSITRDPRPFCEGVRWADEPDGQPAVGADSTGTPPADGTPAATGTPVPSATAATTGTAAGGTGTPPLTPTQPTDCYNSNPPSSGQHLNVQRGVDVTGNGDEINIPPDPDVYPTDIFIPREAIPHLMEHAGVFVGYNCADGDSACQEVVDQLTDLVNDRIDNHDDRVVMARDPDLVEGEMAVASWTRVFNFPYEEYDEGDVENFIGTHACRFDPEGFCG